LSLRVLVIDDEKTFADMLVMLLGREGYEAVAVNDGKAGIDRLTMEDFELVLCDLKMPRMSGLEFLDALGESGIKTTVIMMSAFGTVDLAVEALKRGAYDYISKPFKREEIVLTLRKAEERQQLKERVRELEDRVNRWRAVEQGDRPLIGSSDMMNSLKETIGKLSDFGTTVLITGESGTGKELVARAIHGVGRRAKEPFVAINCGAIPETLLESELFGHVKGAFTDAHADKRGLFVEANGGTLLLDEIGELPAATQVALLRVLQEGEIRPVGATKTRKVDVRIVAATHRDLEASVREGTFREDLFYRLNVVPIHVPPLRNRAADIPDLVDHILIGIAKRLERSKVSCEPKVVRLLMGYAWPGNVRELENVLERAVVLSDGAVLTAESLPSHLRESTSPAHTYLATDELSIKKASAYIEAELIKRALKTTGGNRTHAAKLLEISHRSLLYKLKSYGIIDD
jgi:two-component system response regulator AtoC